MEISSLFLYQHTAFCLFLPLRRLLPIVAALSAVIISPVLSGFLLKQMPLGYLHTNDHLHLMLKS